MVVRAGIRHLRGYRPESQLSAEQVLRDKLKLRQWHGNRRRPPAASRHLSTPSQMAWYKRRKDELSTEEADVLTTTVLA